MAAAFWNGKKWSLSKLPVPAGSKGAWLFAVSCPGAKNGKSWRLVPTE